jgi:T-complex protein 1 subunit gamma
MLKMLMDPMGGIVMTNDGNAILREIQVQHPAAKSLIEIARTQDEECGDGTTSVVILAGEFCAMAEQFLLQQMHPTVIIGAYRRALEDGITIMESLSKPLDVNDEQAMLGFIKNALATKVTANWSDLITKIALKAVKTVVLEDRGRKEIDIKRYAKVEKIPGGAIEDSEVLDGVMFNKDILHPKMRRRIENPRILLLDSSLEYAKGESQTNIEMQSATDFESYLRKEEDYIKDLCEKIIAVKPDVVISEKGVSDLAIHFLQKCDISVIRRLRKTDTMRIARATGATILNRLEDMKESDMGLGAGLFEVKMIGDEYFTYITKCQDPKACTILLRGASKDILNEVERNLQDTMQVTRNILVDPRTVPGGGAIEVAVAHGLTEKAKTIQDVSQWPYRAVAKALEVIPRTLIQNCGGNTIRTLTQIKAKQAIVGGSPTFGVNGETGEISDMNELGVWEPLSVKTQVLKTAIETAILLLRIDDIVSGSKKSADGGGDGGGPTDASMAE